MTVILTLGKLMQHVTVTRHQRLLLPPSPTLHLLLPLESISHMLKKLTIYQINRQTLRSMVCTQPILVLPQSAF